MTYVGFTPGVNAGILALRSDRQQRVHTTCFSYIDLNHRLPGITLQRVMNAR